MTNIVLCFDQAGETNAAAVFRRVDPADQISWHRHTSRRSEQARQAVSAAYDFLTEHWHPGDPVYVFGAGSGAACAQALARLLGTIGVLDGELRDYMLSTYALPRTERSAQEWRRVTEVAAGLAERDDIAVPVRFLGLWDSAPIRGAGGPVDVVEGRHALAIDGGPSLQRVDGVDEVWFRGNHRDIVGGALTLEWMLDGAAQAGLRLDTAPSVHAEPDGSALTLALRRLPEAAAVHASVQMHLHNHPRYWRRLPARVQWHDLDWLDRGERLLAAERTAPTPARVLATAS